MMPEINNSKRAVQALTGPTILGILLMTSASWLQQQLIGDGVLPNPLFFLLPATLGLILGASLGRLRFQRDRALQAANRDRLTELPNRAAFEAALSREVLRAERFGTSLGLIMFDVDHFKSINDTFGHMAGDQVLRAIALAASQVVRRSDMVARWAGDEFVIMAPGTDAKGCRSLAERVRRAVSGLTLVDGSGVTVSLGSAAHVYADTERDLLSRADQALYRAKGAGRNRISRALCLRSTGTAPRVA